MNRLRQRIVIVVALVGASLAPIASNADITSSDFPSKAAVKSELDGLGKWVAATSTNVRAIGAKPAACRSDKQMLDLKEARIRSYYGRQADMPETVTGEVHIGLYRYATAHEAHRAVRRNATYPERCPKVREWVCNDCDGVSTTRRTLVSVPPVGKESVAWTYRSITNFKHAGYGVVARRGKIVVRIEVGRWRDPSADEWTYPPLVSDTVAAAIGKMALDAAT